MNSGKISDRVNRNELCFAYVAAGEVVQRVDFPSIADTERHPRNWRNFACSQPGNVAAQGIHCIDRLAPPRAFHRWSGHWGRLPSISGHVHEVSDTSGLLGSVTVPQVPAMVFQTRRNDAGPSSAFLEWLAQEGARTACLPCPWFRNPIRRCPTSRRRSADRPSPRR